MKALTLTQPWASLVAHGFKQWETRSWRTNHRGLLAIHAAKGFPAAARRFTLESPDVAELCRGGALSVTTLPLGAVIAVCELTRIMPASFAPDEREQRLGNWSPGRWAWRLEHIRRIGPYDVNGELGVWDWPLHPDDGTAHAEVYHPGASVPSGEVGE